MDHEALLALARRRGIFQPAYDIYGGVAGLYEYGPVGARIKQNLEQLWRAHYIAGEGYQEIDAPLLAPEKVFEASGHLSEFDDALAVCLQCARAHRADHLLEGVVPNPDALKLGELDQALSVHDVKCPACGGALDRCRPFNLMFRSDLGAGQGRPVYLRPETAQSIFVSFPSLLRQARGKLPFGVAQVGRSFRNEIAPRQGLIRLREFTHAEVEYFVMSGEKYAARFGEVARLKICLVPNTDPVGKGEGVKMTVGEAVTQGIFVNELVGYHVARAFQFLIKAGLDPERVRFRQHLETEMAHYAADCWDGEALTDLGWIEVVGVADRGCYDLRAHEEHSGTSMRVTLTGRTEERRFITPDKGAIGKRLKAKAKEALETLVRLEAEGDLPEPEKDGSLALPPPDGGGDLLVLQAGEYVIETREVVVEAIPHVIEPSFGIDRIIYSMLSQAYEQGEKEGQPYTILRIPHEVAPYPVALFPLQRTDGLPEKAEQYCHQLRQTGVDVYYDDSRSIGRRYARADEIGIPICMTVDHQTLEDGSVTLRDRDTTEQRRAQFEHRGGGCDCGHDHEHDHGEDGTCCDDPGQGHDHSHGNDRDR